MAYTVQPAGATSERLVSRYGNLETLKGKDMARRQRGINPRPSGIYELSYQDETGETTRESSGTRLMRDAEELLLHRHVQVFLAKEQAIRDAKPPLLLSTMLQTYIDSQHNDVSRRSVERTTRHILLSFGDGPVKDVITPTAFQNYINTRLNVERASRASVWNEIKALRAALNQAVNLKAIPYQVLGDLKEINPSEKPDTRLEYLEVEDLIRILRCSPKWSHPPIITALYTGMRLDEICSLTWEDVDLTGGYLHLGETKNLAGRNNAFMPAITSMLRKIHQEDPRSKWVFKAARKEQLKTDNLERAFHNACLRARREKFDFHHLRHTFASWAVMAGIDIYVVQVLMGHKNVDTTELYAHLSPTHITKQIYWLETEKVDETNTKPIVSRFRLLKEYFTVGRGRGQLHPIVFSGESTT